MIWVYPLKIAWKEAGSEIPCQVQAGFSVSSKIFRKSTERNLLKRRMREAFRINKNGISSGLGEKRLMLMFIYSAREMTDYSLIEKSTCSALRKISRKIHSPAG
jgi:ribonuclease P protein component